MTETETSVLLESNLPGMELVARGKVRDVYQAGEHLLFVASDRISAFDVVLPTGIPDKGSILNQLSLHWFSATQHFQPNHIVTADVSEYPASLSRWREVLNRRSMLVKRAKLIPFECVVRGYLYGGGLKEYEATGQVSGISLPSGLKQAQKFPEPLFTPSTKEDAGHDMPVSEKVLAALEMRIVTSEEGDDGEILLVLQTRRSLDRQRFVITRDMEPPHKIVRVNINRI